MSALRLRHRALVFLVLGVAALGQVAAAGPATAARVDVQMSLCEAPGTVEQALALKPRGKPIEVWLFDDPALTLYGKGLRIRLRGGEHGKGGAELTLKAADQDCAHLPEGALPPGEGKCEYDRHGDKVAGALSLSRKLDRRTANDLLAKRVSVATVLSPAQTHLLQATKGAWPLASDLRALGPTRVRSYRAKGTGYAVDISTLPGGEHFIEISTKVPLAEQAAVHAQMLADLAQAGVAVCADQSAQAGNKLEALLKAR
jgi:hypothetical protein